jgi:hypothetical protein
VLPSHDGPDQDPGRHRSRRWLLVVAGLVAVAVAVVLVVARPGGTGTAAGAHGPGPVGATGTPSATPSGQPSGDPAKAAPPPHVGDCHGYDASGLAAPTDPSPAVPCTAATAVTVAVLDDPPGISLPFDNDAASSDAAGSACFDAVAEFTGQGDAVAFSRLTTGWFQPTADQLAAGQRWVRCDVVMTSPDDQTAPSALPPRGPDALRGSLRGAPSLDVALCGWSGTGAGTLWAVGWRTLPCDDPRSEVMVTGVSVPLGASPGPSASERQRQAAAACATQQKRYGAGLRLTAHPAARPDWPDLVLCTASKESYQKWRDAGAPFDGSTTAPSGTPA